MDWDDYRVFLAVLDHGSLAAGARALGLTQPTARRRLESLEAALKATLLTRSASGITPTATGLRVAAQARAMAAAALTAERDATRSGEDISGRVRLTTPNFMGVEVLPPMLASLRRAHPELTVELDLSDRSVDLLRRDADIAVRMHRPSQDGLTARRLPDIELGFYASEAYMAGRAPPHDLADLSARFDLIGPDRNEQDRRFLESMALDVGEPRLALCTDHHFLHMAAVRAGLGVGVIQAPAARREPGLVRLLPDLTVTVLEMWLVMHEDLREEPRLRAMFDHLAQELTAYARG